ncbi:hypothetical protein [Methylobacterium planeticum]|uniref:Uncharacterized protein n=1 Tax=Methylobacterium planeticum TaxID=2615211 RepID=A0A6N6MNT4_9HYPH|nr:hypothetical protein [Methylobacterium planeticum]KAB1071627.1 hypothetical protein F6X51_18860 [Methylobacterium planeticum]
MANDSGIRDRAETRAAKQQERSIAGAAAWADHEATQNAIEARTQRLRAERLARESTGTSKGRSSGKAKA